MIEKCFDGCGFRVRVTVVRNEANQSTCLRERSSVFCRSERENCDAL